MVDVQSTLLRIVDWKQWQEINFCKHNRPGKVCIWIRHDLQTDTLGVFSEYNTGVQSIHLYQSRIRSYNATNRATNQSAHTDTSKKLEILFGIAFEKCSNGFVIS